MLNINYPKIEKKNYPNLELSLIEPMHKINLRGKNRDFFYKNWKNFIYNATHRVKYKRNY